MNLIIQLITFSNTNLKKEFTTFT